MTAAGRGIARRRFRAPREHGQALIDPPRSEVAALLADNHQHPDLKHRRRQRSPDLFTAQARRELIAAAVDFTGQYRDIPEVPDVATPIVMSGHQPELFHAGVWFKNFLLSSIAGEHQATAINLIVDNDSVDSPAIRVPTGSRGSPRVETVALDIATDAMPFEQRAIHDAAMFDSFAARVCETVRPWIDNPLVNDLWSAAKEARRTTKNFGLAVARTRHVLEGRWGLRTLELPLSIVAALPAFHMFALSRLWNAGDLRREYNAALREYRAVNRIRSGAQPVPDLVAEGKWCETPFWIWTNEEPQRKRLFVRHHGDKLQLADQQALMLELPRDEDGQLDVWAGWEQRGIKIRPRALMTTMYARLVLCDLFIHGIGGAKYDEVTDAIIRRSMGIEPPRYLTATATIQLPLGVSFTTATELRAAEHEAHEMQYRAERYLTDGMAHGLSERKRNLLSEIPPRGGKLAWHDAITRVNEELHELAAHEQQRLDERVARLTEQLRLTRLLGSREFSFCLFPPDFLRTLLLDLSRATP
jgi:hypothetical protein